MSDFLLGARSVADRARLEADVAAGRAPESALAGLTKIVNAVEVEREGAGAFVAYHCFRDPDAWAEHWGSTARRRS